MSERSASTYLWQLSDSAHELEQILGADPSVFQHTGDFRGAMLRAERCVARIETPELEPQGTGFLVAPDLVITNQHVRADTRNQGKRSFDANPAAVRVRFGHVSGNRVSSRAYTLHEEWEVADSPVAELDFCLFRLAEQAGGHRIGDSVTSPTRGWVTPSPLDPTLGQSLFILQHPLGDPLKLADGSLTTPSGDWVEYSVSTDHGSSGSPVFDTRWRCVALHSRAGKGTNRGVSFRAILAAMSKDVRSGLAQPAPVGREESVEGAGRTGGLEMSIDLSRFPAAALQTIGGALLRVVAASGGKRPETFEVSLGGGVRLRCIPGDSAGDVYLRQALEGDLRLLHTRVQVLQSHQDSQAIASVSPIAFTVLIQRTTDDIRSSVGIIRERLEGMIDEFHLLRRE